MSLQKNRIDTIVSLLQPGQPVWDLCCDHGKIGLKAYEKQVTNEVVFVDKVESVVRKLRFEQQSEALDCRFVFLVKDILDLPAFQQPCNIVLAGVGAPLIGQFLDQAEFHPECRLILGPQNKLERLIAFLNKKDWLFRQVDSGERGRTRPILAVEGPFN